MPLRTRGLALASVVLGLAACQSPAGDSRRATADTVGVRQEVRAAIDRVAAATAALDPVAVLGESPSDSIVVYITNGHAIRGSEFVQVVRDHYQRLDSLKVLVQNAEIRPLAHDYATSTVWLLFTSVGKQGRVNVDSSIVTATWERATAGWRWVLWQKATR